MGRIRKHMHEALKEIRAAFERSGQKSKRLRREEIREAEKRDGRTGDELRDTREERSD